MASEAMAVCRPKDQNDNNSDARDQVLADLRARIGAIEQAGPGFDALIDGVLYYEWYWFVVTGYHSYQVEGTPVKTSEVIAQLGERGEDVELTMSKVLYHSSTGLDNAGAIEKIGIIEVNRKLDQTPDDN